MSVVENGVGREVPTLLLMSASCAALAGAAWGVSGPWTTMAAAVVVLIAGAAVVWCSLRRLHGIGRSAVGLVWTALPVVEAGFVAILAVRGSWIFGAVAAVFAVWGAMGCVWLFRRRVLAVTDIQAPGALGEQRIRKGSELG